MEGNSPAQSGIGQETLEPRPKLLDEIEVASRNGTRFVTCFCGDEVTRSIVPHLKTVHPDDWRDWVRLFAELRASGHTLKKIMRLFRAGNGPLLFSWTVVDRAIQSAVEDGTIKYQPPPTKKVKRWEPEKFILADRTVWDFPNRGDWAVHSGDYRGNWPPQLVRNLILKFTSAGDLVVDAFMGGGTSLIEAWLLGRKSVGIDVSKLAIQTTKAKLEEMEHLSQSDTRVKISPALRPTVIKGNSLRLEAVTSRLGIIPGMVKLLCVHPPYLDSLSYTGGHSKDLSQIHDPSIFYRRMSTIAGQANRMLAPDGTCAVLIGDVRKNNQLIPLGFNCLKAFLNRGFNLDSIVIKTQHHDRSTEFYLTSNSGQLLLSHEYLFILRR